MQRDQLVLDGREQLVPHFGQLLALTQLGKIVAGDGPPCFQDVVVSGERLLQR